MVCVSYKAFAEKDHVNNYHILRASLSVCPARSAERTFQASLYTAPFPASSFCGDDLTYSLFSPEQIRFQSAHPLRGATAGGSRQRRGARISIHAPLAGCDPFPAFPLPLGADFNPRTPCGVRPLLIAHAICGSEFQSTHPLRGATGRYNMLALKQGISIHAPLAGCDPR